MCNSYYYRWFCDHRHFLTVIYCRWNPYWKTDVRGREKACKFYREIQINLELLAPKCPGTDEEREIWDATYDDEEDGREFTRGSCLECEVSLWTHKVAKAKHYWRKEHQLLREKDARRWKVIKKIESKKTVREKLYKSIVMRDLRELYAIRRLRCLEQEYLRSRDQDIASGKFKPEEVEDKYKVDGPAPGYILWKLEKLQGFVNKPLETEDLYMWTSLGFAADGSDARFENGNQNPYLDMSINSEDGTALKFLMDCLHQSAGFDEEIEELEKAEEGQGGPSQAGSSTG